jgi:hypothetical protein
MRYIFILLLLTPNPLFIRLREGLSFGHRLMEKDEFDLI